MDCNTVCSCPYCLTHAPRLNWALNCPIDNPWHGPRRKHSFSIVVVQLLLLVGGVFAAVLHSNSHSADHRNTASSSSPIVGCRFAAVGTCLFGIRYLVTRLHATVFKFRKLTLQILVLFTLPLLILSLIFHEVEKCLLHIHSINHTNTHYVQENWLYPCKSALHACVHLNYSLYSWLLSLGGGGVWNKKWFYAHILCCYVGDFFYSMPLCIFF
jgi:hypothetical protein